MDGVTEEKGTSEKKVRSMMEKNFGVWMLEELKLNVPTEWASFRNKAGQGKSLSSY